jgi:hypothetical protein
MRRNFPDVIIDESIVDGGSLPSNGAFMPLSLAGEIIPGVRLECAEE